MAIYMENYQKRTDLAIEIKESFPQDHVEIPGVVLSEEMDDSKEIKATTVEIRTEEGAADMKKPQGIYITLEFSEDCYGDSKREENIAAYMSHMLCRVVQRLQGKEKKTCKTFLLCGLGNRFATPDALGPYVLEKITMNRHLGEIMKEDTRYVFCGIAPGVLSQTGIESSEILQGIVEKVSPDVLIVIDALASRSVNRLCRTIQITDTGIAPGAGIGNNRNQITRETMGIPVIAVGVPTVVDAGTIIFEALEEAFTEAGYQDQEIHQFFHSIANEKMETLFVTPKEIDEEIRQVGRIIACALQKFCQEGETYSPAKEHKMN